MILPSCPLEMAGDISKKKKFSIFLKCCFFGPTKDPDWDGHGSVVHTWHQFWLAQVHAVTAVPCFDSPQGLSISNFQIS